MDAYYIDTVYRCSKCERLIGVVFDKNEAKEAKQLSGDIMCCGELVIVVKPKKQAEAVAKQMGVSRSTYYRDLRRAKLAKQTGT